MSEVKAGPIVRELLLAMDDLRYEYSHGRYTLLTHAELETIAIGDALYCAIHEQCQEDAACMNYIRNLNL